MSDFIFDHQAYLERINHTEEISVSIECLQALHYSQLFTIPFENFDIVLGKGISLEPDQLFKKLVHHHRGGYCFELNGLFLMALQNFGFEARALLGRVHSSDPPSGKGHQFSLVTIDGQPWISDVGFGNGTMQGPLPLVLDQETTVFQQTFRLVETPLYGIMLQMLLDQEWKNQYSFTLNHVFPNDIAYGNHYTSTSPDSYFVQSRTAALPTPHGTHTLYNHSLKRCMGDQLLIEQLGEDQGYLTALDEVFGIKLDVSIADMKPLKS